VCRHFIYRLVPADLIRIPNVAAVANEGTRTTAMPGALRTGAIDTLVATEPIARSVLSLDEATRDMESRETPDKRRKMLDQSVPR